jgi:hypothetical protein
MATRSRRSRLRFRNSWHAANVRAESTIALRRWSRCDSSSSLAPKLRRRPVPLPQETLPLPAARQQRDQVADLGRDADPVVGPPAVLAGDALRLRVPRHRDEGDPGVRFLQTPQRFSFIINYRTVFYKRQRNLFAADPFEGILQVRREDGPVSQGCRAAARVSDTCRSPQTMSARLGASGRGSR